MHGGQAISLGANIQLIMAGQKLQLNDLSENAGEALIQALSYCCKQGLSSGFTSL